MRFTGKKSIFDIFEGKGLSQIVFKFVCEKLFKFIYFCF